MPRFHFPIVDGTKLPDPTGLELRDAAEAKAHSETIAKHLSLIGKHSREVVVVDHHGDEIHRTPVTSIEQSVRNDATSRK
jgi:hypothetical protein